MRIAAFGATLLIAFSGCSTTTAKPSDSPYLQPNSLMTGEITRRVEQIPYQHREELLENLMWLAQTGEQTIPALLTGMQHESPKVRSSCAWVLGRIADRRTIPDLQLAMKDSDPTVRMECARTLVVLGDLTWSPMLIEGLDSDRKEVRYLCHEALKSSTGHDFGYDHLNENKDQLLLSVLRWRQWWGEYAGDPVFAQSYQQKHNLQAQPAQPMGETQVKDDTAPKSGQTQNPDQGGSSGNSAQVELVPLPNGNSNNGVENVGNPNRGTPNSGTPSGTTTGNPNSNAINSNPASTPTTRPNGG